MSPQNVTCWTGAPARNGRKVAGIVLAACLHVGIAAAAENPVVYNRDIRPILSDKCFSCHGPDANHRQADLRLDTRDGAIADLGGRQAVVPNAPEESELVARILSTDEVEQMPPRKSGKTLTPTEIDLLRRWVAEGAEYQPHWAYVVPKRPAIPESGAAAVRTAIDHFLQARLKAVGMEPSPPTDRATLLRRMTLDLTGLPPTTSEIDAFLRDTEPRAEERVVDRLLASPHYGERMAMYWLDLVRYADTVGYHGDQEHHISPYRDWVIQAFNDNLPFDRFTLEQLAGDLLPEATLDQRIASGYNRLLQTSHEGGVQVKEYLHKYDADRLRNLSAAWLGSTVGCAECHDHKYDPFRQRDFYSLVAFFADVDDLRSFKGGDTNPTKREPEIEVLSPIDRRLISECESQIRGLTERIAGPQKSEAATNGSECEQQVEHLRNELNSAEQRLAVLQARKRRTMIAEAIEPRPIRVLSRGDWMDESGELVTPAVPAFLPAIEAGDRRPTRVDLARWLTSSQHPLTARVFVNRIWSLFFGSGLCASLDDFGLQGAWPTHPELLDWLAVELVESGWDVKHLVRLIVLSKAYQQSSVERPELVAIDPENRLFGRQSAFRLPAEMIRDQALAVSGLLNLEMGGPSARPYQPAKYYKHLNFPKREYQPDNDASQYRRGVYVHWQRQYLHPMLQAFDAPTREECTARRPISNTPLAALTLLNDPTFVEAARMLATRIVREGGEEDSARVEWAFRTVTLRQPAKAELAALRRLLETERARYRVDPKAAEALLSIGLKPRPEDIDGPELAAWTAVARVLLNLHETITRS